MDNIKDNEHLYFKSNHGNNDQIKMNSKNEFIENNPYNKDKIQMNN